MSSEVYKNFIIYGALVYWSAAIYMVNKWKGGRHMSFSQHAATEKQSYYLFAVAVSLETIFYLLFAFGWFIPYFAMPFIFGVLIALISALHFTTGIIPETKGRAKWIHRKASYAVAWLFLPALFIISTTSSIPLKARYVSTFYLALLIGIALYGALYKEHRKHFLILQAIFISSLPVTLMAATYIK